MKHNITLISKGDAAYIGRASCASEKYDSAIRVV